MPFLPNLATCKKVGFIVPSSNTAVEPITQAIFASLNSSDVICIFTRIQVKTVGTDSASTSQFSIENMVAAARLLADAQADAIVWNGTSGMWVGTGLEADQQLAKAMQDATGIPCSTTTLATVEALKLHDIKRLSLAVPYTAALAEKLVEFYTGCGFEVMKTARMETTPGSNIEIARTGMEEIKDVLKRSTFDGSGAIVVACTNWPAAGLVEEVEKPLGKLVVDSIVVTAWMGLRMVGLREDVEGWGELMRSAC